MRLSLLFLVACTSQGHDSSPKPGDSDPQGDSTPDTTDSGDATGDSGTPCEVTPGPGIVVLAGGGTEGDTGDTSPWSYRLYRRLLDGGDVTGDCKVRVAILASDTQTEWLPEYYQWMGADEAFNVLVESRQQAEDESLVETFADVDAVFIKGGDQGWYYDIWNDTLLEAQIRRVHFELGGGIAGTSAGAMSQAQYALAGGQDYVTTDALTDSHTSYLDDLDGGSGIHDDFLGAVDGVLIDTHFTERARLGRLAGAMAKTIDDFGLSTLLGIGLEAKTGVVILDRKAEVIGQGSVSFLVPGDSPALRTPGAPLVWTGLRLDRLTEGWVYDLDAMAVDTVAPTAEAVAWDGSAAEAEGEWYVDGDWLEHEERFAVAFTRAPDDYATHAGTDTPVLGDATGVLQAFDEDRRDANEEALFRTLYDNIGMSGFFVHEGTSLERIEAAPEQIEVVDNPESREDPAATLIIDTTNADFRALSPEPSDYGHGELYAAGISGLTLHVLYTQEDGSYVYNSVSRTVE